MSIRQKRYKHKIIYECGCIEVSLVYGVSRSYLFLFSISFPVYQIHKLQLCLSFYRQRNIIITLIFMIGVLAVTLLARMGGNPFHELPVCLPLLLTFTGRKQYRYQLIGQIYTTLHNEFQQYITHYLLKGKSAKCIKKSTFITGRFYLQI